MYINTGNLNYKTSPKFRLVLFKMSLLPNLPTVPKFDISENDSLLSQILEAKKGLIAPKSERRYKTWYEAKFLVYLNKNKLKEEGNR